MIPHVPRLRVFEGGGEPEAWPEIPGSVESPLAEGQREYARRAAERRAAYEKRWHTIYKLFDARGRLLYVGISANGLGRLPEHSQDKAWWRKVARAEFEHVKGRSAAAERELELIRSLDPIHNVSGKVPV